MRGILNRLAAYRTAARGVVALVVLALLTTLVADLHLHTAHAGHGHDMHDLAAIAAEATSSEVASPAAEPQHCIADVADHDRPSGPDGGMADGGSHAACCVVFAGVDLHHLTLPPLTPVHILPASSAVRVGPAVVLERPPRTIIL